MGDDYGHGYGDGSGYGYGYGHGYGDGYGYGYGYGDGYGDGDGDGYGYGYGDGDGVSVGSCGGHAVIALAPWPYLRVGCVVLPLSVWRERWRGIAIAHDVAVTDEEAAAIFAAAEKALDDAARLRADL